jgi:hypothetical protein
MGVGIENDELKQSDAVGTRGFLLTPLFRVLSHFKLSGYN